MGRLYLSGMGTIGILDFICTVSNLLNELLFHDLIDSSNWEFPRNLEPRLHLPRHGAFVQLGPP